MLCARSKRVLFVQFGRKIEPVTPITPLPASAVVASIKAAANAAGNPTILSLRFINMIVEIQFFELFPQLLGKP